MEHQEHDEAEVAETVNETKERIRILIVDDSLVIRALIEELVECEPGSKVVGVASDVPTARRMMNDLLPNVVTLDLNMPVVGGIAFLDELRDHKHPPIVVVSSASSAASAVTKDAIEHGASACFDKAKLVSDRSDFIRTLRDVIRRQNRESRNEAAKNMQKYEDAEESEGQEESAPDMP